MILSQNKMVEVHAAGHARQISQPILFQEVHEAKPAPLSLHCHCEGVLFWPYLIDDGIQDQHSKDLCSKRVV